MRAYRGSVVGFFVALGLLLWASLARSQDMGWLFWTYPTLNAARVAIVDPETGDTTWTASCSAFGGPLSDLGVARVYRFPDELVATIDARGLEGRGDSISVARGFHYWIQLADTTGNRSPCPPMTYLPPLDATGAPTEPKAGDVVLVRLFDASGRQVAILPGWVWDRLWKAHGIMERSLLLRGITEGRLAAGVYFVRGVTRAGTLLREGTKKVVILR